jgi:hypothetical protein
MGIRNIHILMPDDARRLAQVQAARLEFLIAEHREGKHPWGSMRRDCPLCNKRH